MGDALLYDDEWQEVLKQYPDNFKVDYALSREQTNVDGGKMYIQDKVKEYADEVFNRMDSGAHMYFCGLNGMMPGITDARGGLGQEGPRLGGQAQGVEEERPVARRGPLSVRSRRAEAGDPLELRLARLVACAAPDVLACNTVICAI